MRDIKVVAYGSVSEDDERLITNYLEEKMDRVTIFNRDLKAERMKFLEQEMVDSHAQIMDQEAVIDEQNLVLEAHVERIIELEALFDEQTPTEKEPTDDGTPEPGG